MFQWDCLAGRPLHLANVRCSYRGPSDFHRLYLNLPSSWLLSLSASGAFKHSQVFSDNKIRHFQALSGNKIWHWQPISIRSPSGTLALKTKDFSKQSVVLVKHENGFTKTIPLDRKLWKSKEKSVLVKPFSCSTKTTIFTKILGFKGRGS